MAAGTFVRVCAVALGVLLFGGCKGDESPERGPVTKVRAVVQARPGGPVEEVEMDVHAAPVDLPVESAEEADLKDDELVLGLVIDGQAMAYPIRYLAMSEVINGTVGKTPVAPTW